MLGLTRLEDPLMSGSSSRMAPNQGCWITQESAVVNVLQKRVASLSSNGSLIPKPGKVAEVR